MNPRAPDTTQLRVGPASPATGSYPPLYPVATGCAALGAVAIVPVRAGG